MSDDQILAQLRRLHDELARLFELARAAQRKPSRQEALLTAELPATLGQGLELRASSFSRSYTSHLPFVPDAVRDAAIAVFGAEGVHVEATADSPETDEFKLVLTLKNMERVRYANSVHQLTVFLGALAKLDNSVLRGYWAKMHPEEDKRSRERINHYLATALGIVGGYQNLMGRRPFH